MANERTPCFSSFAAVLGLGRPLSRDRSPTRFFAPPTMSLPMSLGFLVRSGASACSNLSD